MHKNCNRWSFVSFGWTQHQLACYNIRSIVFPTQLSSVWTWPLAKCVVTIFVALQKHTQRWLVSGLDFWKTNDTFQIEFELFFSFPSFTCQARKQSALVPNVRLFEHQHPTCLKCDYLATHTSLVIRAALTTGGRNSKRPIPESTF